MENRGALAPGATNLYALWSLTRKKLKTLGLQKPHMKLLGKKKART